MSQGPPQFRRLARPALVNGIPYNYAFYSDGAVRLLFQPKRGGFKAGTARYHFRTDQLVTTLAELSTQYGLRTAALARTALLAAGYEEVV